MAIYRPTGYNDHYMYLNQGMQTMPNGLVRDDIFPLILTDPWNC